MQSAKIFFIFCLLMLLNYQNQSFADERTRAIQRVNYYRELVGVIKTEFIDCINKAAQNHADYYNQNYHGSQFDPHRETEGNPGYTGKTPGERCVKAGCDLKGVYFGEVMAFLGNGELAVDIWINSFYHRIPVIAQHAVYMGYGWKSSPHPVDVMDVGFNLNGNQFILYPIHLQTNVPLDFRPQSEGPNPIPEAGSKLVGYPITIEVPPRFSYRDIKIDTIIIEDQLGRNLPYYKVGPDMYFGNAIGFTTKSPFTKNRTYKITCILDLKGDKHKFYWAFSTGDSVVDVFEPVLVKNKLEFFPNPAKDFISLNIPDDFLSYTLRVYSVDGRLVSSIPIYNKNYVKLETKYGTKIPSGWYTVVLRKDSDFLSSPLIIK